jgi:hypothetical protein
MVWTSAVLDFRESYPAILLEEGPQVGERSKYTQKAATGRKEVAQKMTDSAKHHVTVLHAFSDPLCLSPPFNFTHTFQQCLSAMSFNNVFQQCLSAMSFSSVFRQCLSAASFSNVFQQRLSAMSFSNEVSFSSVFQQRLSAMSFSNAFQRCLSAVSFISHIITFGLFHGCT